MNEPTPPTEYELDIAHARKRLGMAVGDLVEMQRRDSFDIVVASGWKHYESCVNVLCEIAAGPTRKPEAWLCVVTLADGTEVVTACEMEKSMADAEAAHVGPKARVVALGRLP